MFLVLGLFVVVLLGLLVCAASFGVAGWFVLVWCCYRFAVLLVCICLRLFFGFVVLIVLCGSIVLIVLSFHLMNLSFRYCVLSLFMVCGCVCCFSWLVCCFVIVGLAVWWCRVVLVARFGCAC